VIFNSVYTHQKQFVGRALSRTAGELTAEPLFGFERGTPGTRKGRNWKERKRMKQNEGKDEERGDERRRIN